MPLGVCSKDRALVLTEKVIQAKVAEGDCEVLLALAAAINPTMFSDKVEFYQADGSERSEYAVIRIRETGNAYAVHFETAAKLALQLRARTGVRSEILDRIIHENNTQRASRYVQ
jgi:hypothetical protein